MPPTETKKRRAAGSEFAALGARATAVPGRRSSDHERPCGLSEKQWEESPDVVQGASHSAEARRRKTLWSARETVGRIPPASCKVPAAVLRFRSRHLEHLQLVG